MSSDDKLRTATGVETPVCSSAFCRGLSLSSLIKVMTTWVTWLFFFFDDPMTVRLHHKGMTDWCEVSLISVWRLSGVVFMGLIRGHTDLDHDRSNGRLNWIRCVCSLLTMKISWQKTGTLVPCVVVTVILTASQLKARSKLETLLDSPLTRPTTCMLIVWTSN